MKAIFIGGCPRSGTTLLGACLGAHPDVLCLPESPFKTDALRYSSRNPSASKNELLDYIKHNSKFKWWDVDIDQAMSSQDDSDKSVVGILQSVVQQYAEKLKKDHCSYWVDHSPNNIQFAHTLLGVFPDAKFVHLVRDGRAVAASIIGLDWGPNTVYSAARWWLASLSFGLAAESFCPERVMCIKFEDLVLNPQQTLQPLCEFTGIGFAQSILQADGFAVPSWTAKQHSLVGKAFDSSRIRAWEKKLTPREIEIFEHETRDMLLYLGYDLHYDGGTWGPCLREKFKFKVVESWKNFVNSYRFKRQRKMSFFSSRARAPGV